MPRLILASVFILLIFGQNTFAQETSEDVVVGWEIVERCVSDPITPLDDWTFDVTILATGWAGIHGINADWDVPHVQIFRQDNWLDILSSYSPDYAWYAVAQGRIASPRCPSCSTATYYWDNVTVYSTINADELYTHDLNTTFSYGSLITNNPRLVWYDNHHLVLERDGSLFLLNPLTGIETDLDAIISPLSGIDEYFPSPDRTIAVYPSRTENDFNIISLETGEVIGEYEDTPSLFSKWSSNNQYFASYANQQLTIFSFEANEVQLVWDNSEGSPLINFEWSSDSRYLSIQETYSDEDTSHMLLLDMETHEVFSLCKYFESWAWSPNTNRLSMTLLDDEAVYVFELDTWQLINTGIYHEGRIIGWREDPE